jgi:hypothetical protein
MKVEPLARLRSAYWPKSTLAVRGWRPVQVPDFAMLETPLKC